MFKHLPIPRSIRRVPWTSVRQAKKKEEQLRLCRKLGVDWVVPWLDINVLLMFYQDYIPHPWLREVSNSAKELWESFSIGDLVRTVSGESVAKWSSRMRQAHVWGDTALLHGLACAFRVDVAVLMAGTMALVGQSLMQDAVDDCEPLTFIK